jgi:hypothetical protein
VRGLRAAPPQANLIDPDVVWDHEGLRRFFADVEDDWRSFRVDPPGFAPGYGPSE